MINWLALGGGLVFLFGIGLIALDIRQNGTLSLFENVLSIEGWLPVIVSVFGILTFSYGVGN